MFKTKREVDAHVRDLFSKVKDEKERIQKCLNIAKLYASIKEFEPARRHLDTFLASYPKSGEGFKLLGDIHWELSEEEKALEAYKSSYNNAANRETLNRICDLLAQGSGSGDSFLQRQHWFDLQKGEMDADSLASPNSNGIAMYSTPTNGNSSRFFLGSLVSRSLAPNSGGGGSGSNNATQGKSPSLNLNGNRVQNNYQPSFNRSQLIGSSPYTQGSGFNLKTTPKQRLGMGTSCPAPSPERLMLQMSFLEKKCDDVLDRVVEQNGQLLSAMRDMKDSLSGEIILLQNKMTTMSVSTTKDAGGEAQIKALQASFSKEIGAVQGSVGKVREEIRALKGALASATVEIQTLQGKNAEFTVKFEEMYDLVVNRPPPQTHYPVTPPLPVAPAPVVQVKTETPVTSLAGPAFSFSFNSLKTPPSFSLGGGVAGKGIFGSSPFAAGGGKGADNADSKVSTAGPILGANSSLFSNLSGVGFGDLASSKDAFSKPADFKGFGGSGQSIFVNVMTTTPTKSTTEEADSSNSRGRRPSEGEEGGDDFVPTAEFAPVIPLPPLVEVKLGDEDETAVFKQRAKIYRFDSSVKEWKERGVGDIKILQNNDNPSAVRVVMWREKVGKLACNHRVKGDMKMEFYMGQKVVKWTAIDHAEDEARPEIFTCKFGTEEKCAEFKQKFEEMVDLVASSSFNPTPTKSENPPPKPQPQQQQQPLSELFKKAEGAWDCSGCYMNNGPEINTCPACATHKPGYTPPVEVAPETPQTVPAFSFGFNVLKTPPSFSLGGGGTGGEAKSIFGSTPLAVKAEDSDAKLSTTIPVLGANSSLFSNLSGVGFGDLATSKDAFSKPADFKGFGGSGQSIFGNVTTTTPTKSGTEEADSSNSRGRRPSEGEEGGDDFVPTAEFAPVIPLPPLVEVKLGDEDETAVFKQRAKIYRFDSSVKEWKERGVGDIKILQNNDNPSAVRVVMWREKVGKLACNHRVKGDMKMEFYMGQKVVKWTAIDHAEDEARPEIFTCKFGTEEKCAEFKQKFEEMVDLIASSPSTTTPTKSDNNSPPKPQQQQQPLSELFKKAEGAWDCSGCYMNNGPEINTCPACATHKPGYTPPAEVAPETPQTVPAFSFGFNVLKTPPSFSVGGDGNKSIFGSSLAGGMASTEKADAKLSTTVPVLGTSSSLFSNLSGTGFGDLATSKEAFSKPADFKGFGGSGQSIFGNMMTPTKTTEDNDGSGGRRPSEGEEGGDDFVPTAEFAPVIPLPPLVEVKLGDEDETAVFKQRAKIYRFDSSVKEWKERGVGDIKILQNNDNPSAVRVVMWREKVGKLACNHRVKGDMKMEFYMGQKVVKWTAIDHAEDEARPEIFTCKFGTEEKCAEFKQKFEEMVDLVSNSPSNPTPTKSENPPPKPQPQQQQQPLSELFKKAEGAWDCSGCYMNNGPEINTCPSCTTPKPGYTPPAEVKSEIVLPTLPQFTFGFTNPLPMPSFASMPTFPTTTTPPSSRISEGCPAAWANFDVANFS